MARYSVALLACCLIPMPGRAAPLPLYLWHEPEWFDGVQGTFAYWTGTAKPTGSWGVAGPGISAEWTQGGESEWNSMGAPAEETRALCHRDLLIPRAGRYRIWVRRVDHRGKTSPFKVQVESAGKNLVSVEVGARAIVPRNDEYQLYWGFSFGWESFTADLPRGPVRLKLVIDRAGQAWRQVDVVLLTTDLAYEPIGREKPPFVHLDRTPGRSGMGAAWRGEGVHVRPVARPRVAGRDFSMWTTVEGGSKWWAGQKVDSLSGLEVLHAHCPPADIRQAFHKQFSRPGETPLLGWPHLLPGVYLGTSPDLSPGSGLRKWLERTKTPFYILTNYANPTYDDRTGPGTYQALTGLLAEQFLGYIHGEAMTSEGVPAITKPLGKTRSEHLSALARHLRDEQAKAWSKFYRTPVSKDHRRKSIPCLSVDSLPLAHLFYEEGSPIIGYEADATNVHVPMRIAFLRGAARQYGGAWINYASGNFGDACNYFSQEPQVPRGAKSWFHSKYAVTDGVSASWYRKMYYLNYLSGASAIFWEQGLANQWIQPGPGSHPIQLSPFGRCTEDFQAFVSRLPDRGEPVTPVAFLLGRAHGYEPVNYSCKMLHHFPQSPADRELRELFNVAWHPTAVIEGEPAAPDRQSLPSGIHGNVFDVLVDNPTRAGAIQHYPVIWAAGDVDLSEEWQKVLEEYLKQGGTLVVNIEVARKLPVSLTGVKATGKRKVCERWKPEAGTSHVTVPFEVEQVERPGAKVLAWADEKFPLITRMAVGKGAVVVTLVPRMLGQDERAHPALGYLMDGLLDGLLPVEVVRGDGRPLAGEVLHQVNATKTGWLVLLMNNRGIDKTQNGVARVDRRQWVEVVIRPGQPITAAREHTQPRELKVEGKGRQEVRIRVEPGDVQVVELQAKR